MPRCGNVGGVATFVSASGVGQGRAAGNTTPGMRRWRPDSTGFFYAAGAEPGGVPAGEDARRHAVYDHRLGSAAPARRVFADDRAGDTWYDRAALERGRDRLVSLSGPAELGVQNTAPNALGACMAESATSRPPLLLPRAVSRLGVVWPFGYRYFLNPSYCLFWERAAEGRRRACAQIIEIARTTRGVDAHPLSIRAKLVTRGRAAYFVDATRHIVTNAIASVGKGAGLASEATSEI